MVILMCLMEREVRVQLRMAPLCVRQYCVINRWSILTTTEI